MIDIKNRWTGEVICSGETLRATVEANLADLYEADLSGANLSGADLDGANIAWQSHDLIAEILKRAAGDDVAKLKVAGYILIRRDQCWVHFADLRDPLAGWACGVLREWVRDDSELPSEAKAVLFAEAETPTT